MKTFILIILQVNLFFHVVRSQEFTYHSDSPFGIVLSKGTLGVPATNFYFFDYDFDGDQDLFQVGLDQVDNFSMPAWEDVHFFLKIQKNIGNKINPVFSAPMDLDSNFPFPVGYFFPAIGDINADGVTDYIVNADIDEIGNQSLLQMTGLGIGAGYDIVNLRDESLDPFVPDSYFFPHLVDLDKDGDLDLMMSGFLPAFGEENGPDIPEYYYARNAGTPQNPVFEGWYNNPYSLMPHPGAETLTSGDIDNDGDIDLVGTTLFITEDSISHIHVHLNTPVNNKPSFTTDLESPFGLPTVVGENQLLSQTLVDIDGDGDRDFFVLERTADTSIIRYYNNNFCVPETTDVEVTRCENDPPVIINGIEYFNSAIYQIMLQGSDGCDSTVNLTLYVIPITEVNTSETICMGESVTIGGDTFDETGSYTIYVAAANGCDSIIFLDLTVIPPAEEEVDATICFGETYTVGTETFNIEGQYFVQLPASGGCDSLVNLTLEVIEVDNTVTLNGTTLMANFSNGFYQWFNCDTGEDVPFASQQNLTPIASGNYAVRITDNFGCTVTSACTLVIITATEDEFITEKIKLFPNPASEEIYILNTSGYVIESIGLSDLSGRTLLELKESNNHSIDVSDLTGGVYSVKIVVNGMEVVRQVVVQ